MLDLDLAKVMAAAAADPAFVRSSCDWTADVVFRIDGQGWRLRMRDGAILGFGADDAPDQPADVTISAPADGWDKLLTTIPPPPYDDVYFGGNTVGFVVEGDLIGAVAPYYQAIQDLIAIMRQVRNGPGTERSVPDVDRKFDAAVGRYMYIHVDGVQYRVYFEEAGDGPIPLLLQHTAAADGRQWRHLLEDPDYRRLYRMIAYDLPYHGKSLPPTSQRWWEEEYKLTKDFLIKTVLAISHGLDLDRPVFMGCSVGGFLAPDLALNCPEEFRAVIGINSGLSFNVRSTELEDSWGHPRVGSQWVGAAMVGCTAPTSPLAYRHETGWIYSQSAPSVMKGDVFYYSHDHHITAERAAEIDTSKIDVYLLTGEYDPLAGENGTARLAAAIKGCHFQILKGLGHFGISENPDDFKPALLPILEEIAAAATEGAPASASHHGDKQQV